MESIIRKAFGICALPVFVDGEQANTQPALWREPPRIHQKEQYDKFYTHLTYDNKPPLDVEHISVDVPVQFTALLYIPDTERDFSAPSAITGAWISMPGVCSSSTTTRNCCRNTSPFARPGRYGRPAPEYLP